MYIILSKLALLYYAVFVQLPAKLIVAKCNFNNNKKNVYCVIVYIKLK